MVRKVAFCKEAQDFFKLRRLLPLLRLENLRRGMVAIMESSQGLRVFRGPPPPPLSQPVPPPPPVSALRFVIALLMCTLFPNRKELCGRGKKHGCFRPNLGMPISSSHMSLKEMLERIAAQHDLTHIPQRDRLKEGRQVCAIKFSLCFCKFSFTLSGCPESAEHFRLFAA